MHLKYFWISQLVVIIPMTKKLKYLNQISQFSWNVAEMVKRLLSTPKVSGSNPREAQKFSKPFWIFLDHIVSSVHPARWTVISSRFNCKIVIAREVCQVSWLQITLAGKARTKSWEWFLIKIMKSYEILTSKSKKIIVLKMSQRIESALKIILALI